MKIIYWSVLLVICFIKGSCVFGQTYDTIDIQFRPCFGATPLEPNTLAYKLSNDDSISVEMFKCYISKMILLDHQKVVYSATQSFHLLDIDQANSLHITIPLPTNLRFTTIQFLVGIDSITNNAGALGGDLDPTQGMYWSWQSGYINAKIEGRSHLSPTPAHDFQFHLGGYQYPYNAATEVQLNTVFTTKIAISINLKSWFDQINFTTQHHIMSPSEEAVRLAKLLATCFEIKN